MVGLGVGGHSSNDGAHEFLIAEIVYIVVMGEVASFFIFTWKVVIWMHGYRMAIEAAVVVLVIAFGMGMVELGRGRA